MQEEAEPGALAAALLRRRGSCRRSSRRCRRAAGRARRPSCPGRSRGRSARRACRPRRTTRGSPYASCSSGREQRRLEERHALVQHAGVAGRAHVLGDDVAAATADRRNSACAARGRSARATSAARRLRRTAGPRRAAGARAPDPAARATAPSRPAADRGSRTRRPAGSSRRASTAGSSRPDTAASGSSARRTNRRACAPEPCRACASHDACDRAQREPPRAVDVCRDARSSRARGRGRCPGPAGTASCRRLARAAGAPARAAPRTGSSAGAELRRSERQCLQRGRAATGRRCGR